MNTLISRDQTNGYTYSQSPARNFRIDGFNGFIALFEEFVNLFRRADKRYADSRRYQSSSTAKYDGKVAVITGGDKDIGAETAAHLVKYGFRVIIGVNEEQSGVQRDSIHNSSNTRAVKLDLSSLESVREFAKEVKKLEPKIDLLINSGQHFEKQNVLTKDGIEKNFAENYLGHYLLTNLLLNNLKKSENGRIVNVSSIAHYFGSINFKDLNNSKFYIPYKAYSQSKLAQVLFTRELSKRLIDTNITVYAVSPEIFRNNVMNFPNNPQIARIVENITNPMNGSQTILYVSLEDSLKNESGFYYTNLKKVHPLLWNATDDTVAEKLWTLSEELVKLDEESKVKGIKRQTNSQPIRANVE